MNNPNAIDNLIPIKPGKSGNPKGRKPGTKNMSTILRQIMDVMIKNPKLLDQYKELFPEYFKDSKGKKPKELIMLRLMTKALEGDLKAIDMILERTEGKVSQPIENLGESDNKIEISFVKADNETRVS